MYVGYVDGWGAFGGQLWNGVKYTIMTKRPCIYTSYSYCVFTLINMDNSCVA